MKNHFLITLFLLIPFLLNACDCQWGGNFIKSSQYGDLIIMGKVVDRTYNLQNGERFSNKEEAVKKHFENEYDKYYGMGESITIEILEIIRGKELRKMIQIFDSDGADCRDSTGYFEIGKFYVFNLYKPNRAEPKLPNETLDDYAIFGCSENWIEYLSESNKVRGHIKGINRSKTRTYPYNRLKRKIT